MDTISPVKVRVVGIILLIIVAGITAGYALATDTNNGYFTNEANSLVGTALMMSGVFTVLGFGLTMAYFG